MKKAQKSFLEARYKKFYVKGWDELLIKLKKHGGEMIAPMTEPEEHVRLLLKDGRIFDTTKRKLEPGELHHCHTNAGRLWAENEHLQLVTGYALYKDGELWYQHSWLFNPTTGELIETTPPAEKYFGVVLNDEQALNFYFANVPEQSYTPRVVRIAESVVKAVESRMYDDPSILI